MEPPGWNKEWREWREERLKIGRERYALKEQLRRKDREMEENGRRMPKETGQCR